MDDEFVAVEKETVGLGFPGVVHHVLLLLLGQLGQVVDELAVVLAAWHAERELELEVYQQPVPEVVSLHQHQVFHGLIAHHIELQFQTEHFVVEELGAEVVLDGALLQSGLVV